MATKWYLRALVNNPVPTSGEKSTTEPVGAQTYGLTPTDRDLSPIKGASATSAATTLPNSTTANNGTLGRWSSGELKAGTYGSGSWTIAIQTAESDANYNVFWRTASIYFWRPGTSSVVGFVVDSNTQTGVEFGNGVANARYGQVITWTGSNVTIQDGDILVIEAWTGGTPTMAGASKTATIYYDGTTDVTAAYSGTDPASYIQAPANIPQLQSLAVNTGVANNLRTACSAKASLSVARPESAKSGSSSSAKASVLGKAVAFSGKVPISSGAKSAAFDRDRGFTAKSGTATSAKQTGGSGLIALDSMTSGSNLNPVTPVTSPISTTISHTLGGGGSRMVVVLAAYKAWTTNDGANPSSIGVTYDGTPMTQAASLVPNTSQQSLRMAIFYLLESSLPAAGTYNVVVTGTQGIQQSMAVAGQVVSMTNATQSAPEVVFSDPVTGGSYTSVTDGLTTLSDKAWSFAALGGNQNSTLTLTGAQTGGVTIAAGGGTSSLTFVASRIEATSPAGAATFSYTSISPAWNRYPFAAIAVAPASAVGFLVTRPVIVDVDTSTSAKCDLTVTAGAGPVVLAGSAATSASAKATVVRNVAVVAKCGTSSSAKATMKVARTVTAKAATSNSAKATRLNRNRPVSAKAATSNGGKATRIVRNCAVVAKCATSGNAKASLARVQRVTAKAQTSSSSKATRVNRTQRFIAKLASSSSGKSTRANRIERFTAKAAAADSAKATALVEAKRLSAKSATSTSAKCDLTTAGVSVVAFSVKVPTSCSARGALRRATNVSTKVGTASGTRAACGVRRNHSTKLPTSSSSKATRLNRNRRVTAKSAASHSGKGTRFDRQVRHSVKLPTTASGKCTRIGRNRPVSATVPAAASAGAAVDILTVIPSSGSHPWGTLLVRDRTELLAGRGGHLRERTRTGLQPGRSGKLRR